MAATLDDVARQAGVSIATASRALSGSRRVTPELAHRVREVAVTLSYRPNALAQGLRRQQSRTIGFVVPQISNPFFPAIFEAVERELQETGMDLFLCDSQLDPAIELRRVRALLSRQIDGLLISPVSFTASAAALDEACASVPVTQIDRFVEGHAAGWVGLDDYVGMDLVMRHLAGQGALTTAFVSGRADSSSGRLRLDGYRRAGRRLGVRSVGRALLGTFTREWGQQAAHRILAAASLPRAIVCGNDEIAIGLIPVLQQAGVAVPRDVLVTGYDDVDMAALVEPALTTVRQPREAMAVAAVRLLTSDSTDAKRVSLPPTLVVRQSA